MASDSLHLYLMGAFVSSPLLLLFLYPTAVLRYLRRKRYQYEVTFSLYMMTPTEKFIFNSILFLLMAMVSIATALYLPASISNVLGRGWWYILGDDTARPPLVPMPPPPSSAAAAGGSSSVAEAVGEVLGEWYGHGSQNLHEL